jgi:hypothetical protein
MLTQGEQQQHGGLEGQHFGRDERAEGGQKYSEITGLSMLAG